MELKYKRVVLKLSGEALAGNQKTGLDFNVINEICASIKKCVDAGAEIGIVVGGGNFWSFLRKYGSHQSGSHRDACNNHECPCSCRCNGSTGR